MTNFVYVTYHKIQRLALTTGNPGNNKDYNQKGTLID